MTFFVLVPSPGVKVSLVGLKVALLADGVTITLAVGAEFSFTIYVRVPFSLTAVAVFAVIVTPAVSSSVMVTMTSRTLIPL